MTIIFSTLSHYIDFSIVTFRTIANYQYSRKVVFLEIISDLGITTFREITNLVILDYGAFLFTTMYVHISDANTRVSINNLFLLTKLLLLSSIHSKYFPTIFIFHRNELLEMLSSRGNLNFQMSRRDNHREQTRIFDRVT